jgi:hypothetical protein
MSEEPPIDDAFQHAAFLQNVVAAGRGFATLTAPRVHDAPLEPPVVFVGPAREYGCGSRN